MVQKQWLAPPPVDVPESFEHFIGGHPLVGQTLVRRGIEDFPTAQGFLNPERYVAAHPEALPDLEAAAARLERAIAEGQKILIWGDFDVDGQTSTALLVETLRDLGADPAYYIPVRARDSHGIHLDTLTPYLEQKLDVLLTCDTGISENEAIDEAEAHGVDVIITDHHLPPDRLPAAYAIVNPQMLPDGHPLKTLPGVGVAYQLALALYVRAGRPEQARKLLDLVALGIVADVADQVADTRYLLQMGLEELRKSQRVGLQKLVELAELNPLTLDSQAIGFGIGPRLNALGRLGDANEIVEFLLSEDREMAAVMANRLEGLNAQRKLETEQIYQAVLAIIEQSPELLRDELVLLAQPGWHGGVLGIVASRLVETYDRPCLLLSIRADGQASGSARSTQKVHINDAIRANADRLTSYGGHAAAAGVSLPAENIAAFRDGLAASIRAQAEPDADPPMLKLDGELDWTEIDEHLIADLDRLAPFGAGNPQLVLFTRNLTIKSSKVIGRARTHRRLVVADSTGEVQPIVWWRGAAETLPPEPADIAYTLGINEFRDKREVQLTLVAIRSSDPEAMVVEQMPLEVIDRRRSRNVDSHIELLSAQEGTAIWGENLELSIANSQRRDGLSAATTLVIWSHPPSPSILHQALEATGAQKVVLMPDHGRAQTPNSLLSQIAGLLKHVYAQRDGKTSLTELAGLACERQAVIDLALDWIQVKGYFDVKRMRAGKLMITKGSGQTTGEIKVLGNRLAEEWRETQAYRDYFARAEITALFPEARQEQ